MRRKRNPRGKRALKRKMKTARKLAMRSFRVRIGKKRGCRKVGKRRYCSIGKPSLSKKYIGIARASKYRKRKAANPKRPKARRKSCR